MSIVQEVGPVQEAGSSGATPADWFDLPITVVDDSSCVASDGCDTSDGCSSTCPSACASS
ncbi:FxLD family lanthipeptide [Protofrankia symbiont of Coriaria ruscifolia]|uniref:FxLD family lanthipeptide n=1 Tax=Protofrankia symbiont of Coriaria ruscifolia TaxID=1306542 RepID=UPI001041052D|nr:FxLD family lanthipeptide [Protofrankia symbiont of Coriaria ruscifolia]